MRSKKEEELLLSATHKAKVLGDKAAKSRQFRDALTRASGAIKGSETQAMQWDRWTP